MYILTISNERDRPSCAAMVLSIHSLGIPSIPYLAPKHAHTKELREQLHPPDNITYEKKD